VIELISFDLIVAPSCFVELVHVVEELMSLSEFVNYKFL